MKHYFTLPNDVNEYDMELYDWETSYGGEQIRVLVGLRCDGVRSSTNYLVRNKNIIWGSDYQCCRYSDDVKVYIENMTVRLLKLSAFA